MAVRPVTMRPVNRLAGSTIASQTSADQRFDLGRGPPSTSVRFIPRG